MRSGSTLLRLMLDHHPEIAFDKEFDFAVALVSSTGQLPSMQSYLEWIKYVRGVDYAVNASLDYREQVNEFLRQKQAMSGGKKCVGATVHAHFDRLRFLWPHARYVHLVRDPRDVARSVLQKGWAGNLYQASGIWIQAEDCWESLATHLVADQAIELHYEDLVAQTEVELSRICKFIGVEFAPSMLDYQVDAPQYPPPNHSLASQWKTKLSPRRHRDGRASDSRQNGESGLCSQRLSVHNDRPAQAPPPPKCWPSSSTPHQGQPVRSEACHDRPARPARTWNSAEVRPGTHQHYRSEIHRTGGCWAPGSVGQHRSGRPLQMIEQQEAASCQSRDTI